MKTNTVLALVALGSGERLAAYVDEDHKVTYRLETHAPNERLGKAIISHAISAADATAISTMLKASELR